MKHKIWPGALAAAVFAADRMTKMLAEGLPEEGRVLIPGVLGLTRAENRGMAFSLLSGQPWLLGLVSLAIIAGAFFALRGKKLRPGMTAGLAMMLGGAAGNMADRLFRGYVPDMIEVLFAQFAVFNVADVFLCVGCGVVIFCLFFSREEEQRAEDRPAEEEEKER